MRDSNPRGLDAPPAYQAGALGHYANASRDYRYHRLHLGRDRVPMSAARNDRLRCGTYGELGWAPFNDNSVIPRTIAVVLRAGTPD
jgi:hypothetical protein